MRKSVPASVLVVAAAASACGIFGPESVAEELREHRRAWLRQNIDDYTYDYQALCFCGNVDPILIEVRDNVITSATNKTTGLPVPQNQLGQLHTMVGLYDYLIDAAQRADDMSADFDNQRHTPVEVRIDFERNAIDDELVIKTGNLSVIGSARRVPAKNLPAPAR